MTALPYLRQGTIHIVPILRHRLNFAVQVQRAVRDRQLGPDDLIAVALPESVHEPLIKAVARLPRISIITSWLQDRDQREVFPVTPADGMVEAVRIAGERGVPLRFIDQELAPGHLLDRYCISDDAWPDDGLALFHGSAEYLRLAAGRTEHPPTRFEPIDTWRELHMAAELQRFYPRYARILFVCDATHVRPVLRLLGSPALQIENRAALPAARYEIRDPALPVLMRYLDHIPRLVEQYEELRQRGQAADFDKRTHLLQIVSDVGERAVDLRLSIRHYQAFTRILSVLLEREKRVSPTLSTVLSASGACFGTLFKERLFRHLLGYYDIVRTERLGRVRGTRELLAVVNTSVSNPQPEYVARNCLQTEEYVEIVSVTPEERAALPQPDFALDIPLDEIIEFEEPPSRSPARRPNWRRPGWERTTWPPADEFAEVMRAKAQRLANATNRGRTQSLEFDGSLHDGLDFRRTLRSYYKRNPKLYVQQTIRSSKRVISRNEPVVWIFDNYELADPAAGDYFEYTTTGAGDEVVVADWSLTKTSQKEEIRTRDGESARLDLYPLYGRVMFVHMYATLAELHEQLGENLRLRSPSPADIHDIDAFLRGLAPRFYARLDSLQWWEVLLIGALAYAKEAVVLVAPPPFTVSSSVAAQAAANGLEICHVPSTMFTLEEQRVTSLEFGLEHRYPVKRPDLNDPVHRTYVVEHFSEAMKRFWDSPARLSRA